MLLLIGVPVVRWPENIAGQFELVQIPSTRALNEPKSEPKRA